MFARMLDFGFSKLSENFKNSIRYSVFNYLWNVYLNFRARKSTYYGQLLEDRIIEKYCPESFGKYVDVGAGHPVRGSNSYLFYRKGWRGVTVDPIDKNISLHRLFRRKDKQIACLIGQDNLSVKFFHFEPYEYSTTDIDIAEEVMKNPKVKLLSVDVLTMQKMRDLGIKASFVEPTFLTIDVEGKDFEVLKSIDWVEYSPRVICIESWSDNGNNRIEIQYFLESRNYKYVESVGLSHIFVHNLYELR